MKMPTISMPILIVASLLIVLPSGVYVTDKIFSRQQNPEATQQTEIDSLNNQIQSLTPVTEQSTNQNQSNSQPTSTNNDSNKSSNTYVPTPTSTQSQPPDTNTTQDYVYEKPQCSNTLRTSAINTLVSGYNTQANRKNIQLDAWYKMNYQLPTYTHQQFLDREANNQAWLDNYIENEIAQKNVSLNEYSVCAQITRNELGI